MEKLVPPGEPPNIGKIVSTMYAPERRHEPAVIRSHSYPVNVADCAIIAVETNDCMPVAAPAFDCGRAVAAFVRNLRAFQPWAKVVYVYHDGRKVEIK